MKSFYFLILSFYLASHLTFLFQKKTVILTEFAENWNFKVKAVSKRTYLHIYVSVYKYIDLSIFKVAIDSSVVTIYLSI